LLETFQSSVVAVVETAYVDDVSRQDWASNSAFRKAQHFSYGINGTLLTTRGIIHDLLICCCSPKLRVYASTYNGTEVRESVGRYQHGGTIASTCVELVTSVLRVITELYSTIRPSRTRHGQWAADFNGVIFSTVEVLCLLHSMSEYLA
jgi:hypothetical protein